MTRLRIESMIKEIEKCGLKGRRQRDFQPSAEEILSRNRKFHNWGNFWV
jgi:hypothetical protein